MNTAACQTCRTAGILLPATATGLHNPDAAQAQASIECGFSADGWSGEQNRCGSEKPFGHDKSVPPSSKFNSAGADQLYRAPALSFSSHDAKTRGVDDPDTFNSLTATTLSGVAMGPECEAICVHENDDLAVVAPGRTFGIDRQATGRLLRAGRVTNGWVVNYGATGFRIEGQTACLSGDDAPIAPACRCAADACSGRATGPFHAADPIIAWH